MIGLPTNFMHTGHIGSGDMSPQQEQQEQNNVSQKLEIHQRLVKKSIVTSTMYYFTTRAS